MLQTVGSIGRLGRSTLKAGPLGWVLAGAVWIGSARYDRSFSGGKVSAYKGAFDPPRDVDISSGYDLIEGAATNLILKSEDFAAAPWAALIGASVPDAETINLPDVNDYVIQTLTSSISPGDSRTIGVELKGTPGETVTLRLARSGAGTYEQATTRVTLTSEWQKASVSHTFVNAQTGYRFDIMRISAADTATTFKARRAQSNEGATLDDYLQTDTQTASRAAATPTAKQGLGPELASATFSEEGGWTYNDGVIVAAGSSGIDRVLIDLTERFVPGASYLVTVPNDMPATGFYVDPGSGAGSQFGNLDASYSEVIITPTADNQVVRIGRWSGSPSGSIGPISVKRILPTEEWLGPIIAEGLGDELVTNTELLDEAYWTTYGETNFPGAVVNILSTDGSFSGVGKTDSSFVVGSEFELTVVQTRAASGSLKFQFSSDPTIYRIPGSVGTHTLRVVNNGSATFSLARDGGATDIDVAEISLREFIPEHLAPGSTSMDDAFTMLCEVSLKPTDQSFPAWFDVDDASSGGDNRAGFFTLGSNGSSRFIVRSGAVSQVDAAFNGGVSQIDTGPKRYALRVSPAGGRAKMTGAAAVTFGAITMPVGLSRHRLLGANGTHIPREYREVALVKGLMSDAEMDAWVDAA